MGGARHRSAPSAFMAGDCDTGLAFQLFKLSFHLTGH
jgi:hypothetical protein